MPEKSDPGARDAVVLHRSLPVTPDDVWPLWTDPTRFAAWYGPPGATVTVHVLDVQVGGERQVSLGMETPEGEREMHFAGVHLVVDEPTRLHYTEAVVEAPGAVPDEAATEVQLLLRPSAEGTSLTLTHLGVPSGSPGEAGWSAALDALESLVST
jgi:uncharacterized protein YndB with AHSA1/START domain